jgi:hypothetical protein
MRTQHYLMPALAVAVLLMGPSCSRTPAQSKFATPDDAAKALLQALKADNMEQIAAIFGRKMVEEMASGDTVSDKRDREVVRLAMEQSWRWAPLGPDRQELIIGDEQWPFPFPLAKSGDRWVFDADAGKEEVIARRIGRNELGVIGLCRWYVDGQKEYAAEPHDGKQAGLYAQRLRSARGHQDGLYWETNPDEKTSPLGDLVAEAAEEGYAKNRAEGSPFWGYRFRILTGQGGAAPGGKKNYVVNGDMPGGFGLVAYPARYGSSGIMTFIVNQDRVVYQKDLGKDTLSLAANMTEYNPDSSWTSVQMP